MWSFWFVSVAWLTSYRISDNIHFFKYFQSSFFQNFIPKERRIQNPVGHLRLSALNYFQKNPNLDVWLSSECETSIKHFQNPSNFKTFISGGLVIGTRSPSRKIIIICTTFRSIIYLLGDDHFRYNVFHKFFLLQLYPCWCWELPRQIAFAVKDQVV